MSKVIGIVGSRRRDTDMDKQATWAALADIYEEGDTLVSGGCSQGGDRFCEEIGRDCDIPVLIHVAQWAKLGRSAGFTRNTYIARDADILIAVVAPDRKGGTEDTVRKFTKFHPKGLVILV